MSDRHQTSGHPRERKKREPQRCFGYQCNSHAGQRVNQHADHPVIHHVRLAPGRRRAFSLIELVTVLAVTVVLTALMFPALSEVRENVNRLMCSSQQRQFGLAVTMYARDHGDDMPHSYMLQYEHQPEALTLARLEHPNRWDSLGLLYRENYCGAPECLFCPSHPTSANSRIAAIDWKRTGAFGAIDTDYHYAGHQDWVTGVRRRLDDGHKLILTTDRIPTGEAGAFNHELGMNVLRGDGSVHWEDNAPRQVAEMMSAITRDPGQHGFRALWRQMEDTFH